MTLIIGIVDITRVLYGNTEYWILNEFCYPYCMYNLLVVQWHILSHQRIPNKSSHLQYSWWIFSVCQASSPFSYWEQYSQEPSSHSQPHTCWLLTHGHNHTISFFWAECLYHCPPGTWVHLGSTPCKTPGIIYETDIHCAQQLSSLHHAHYWGSSTAAKGTTRVHDPYIYHI